MSDFYSDLSAFENEALRRVRQRSEAERAAAERFNRSRESAPPPPPPRHHAPPPPGHHPPFFGGAGPLGSLLGGALPEKLLRSPDTGLILLLFFILRSEQSDPLLMLALMYILM